MYRTLINPISEMQQMFDLMDRAFGTNEGLGGRTETPTYSLAVNIYEKDNSYFVKAAVPGVNPENLDIDVENGVLTLKGETHHEFESDKDAKVWRREYNYGSFARAIRLPEDVNLEAIEANFDNGFVTIVIPKVIEQKKALKVPVRTGGQLAGQKQALESNATNGRGSEKQSKEPVGAGK